MRGFAAASWHVGGKPGGASARLDAAARIAAGLLLCLTTAWPWITETMSSDDAARATPRATASTQAAAEITRRDTGREILVAGYAGAPFYYRSDVQLQRPDGTDVVLKGLGWDGDALYFPIDGGIRSVEWWQSFGFMVDFLHNKAIARLGRGAHGRKLANPVIEEVGATGTIAGQPAPARLKLTDQFERFEFTHGHNVLLFTPMLRLGSVYPGVRPYLGAGGGFALPHVEEWRPGSTREDRTSEYQLAGPAAQLVAGLELRSGRMSYFIEYKFTAAWIRGALTGDQSWKNFNMPGDLWRQFQRWWRGEQPRLGRFSTWLGAHQGVAGAGYWLQLQRRPR